MDGDRPDGGLDDMLEHAPCGFLRFSDDETILNTNATLRSMLGYSAAEIHGHPVDLIFPPAAKVLFQTHLLPTLRFEHHLTEVYISLRTKNGESLPVSFNATRHEHGGTQVADCVFAPMSERERFENAILAAKKEAVIATRKKDEAYKELEAVVTSLARAKERADLASRAKDDFLAALSHELRTPLTPALIIAAALENDPSLPPAIKQQVSTLHRNIDLEAKLIDDLLDIARIRNGKFNLAPVVVDLHEVIAHAITVAEGHTEGRKHSLSLALDAQNHHALVDPIRCQQVFWNLLKNALKFTPEGGTITVETTNTMPGSIAVRVTDTGIGIASENLPNVFNRFEQGTAAGQHRYGGLGLGLAISHAIIIAHGGRITAESDGVGHGASFTVTLKTAAPAARSTPRSETPATSTAPLRILVIEDNRSTRQVLDTTLTSKGHVVTTASTIAEARDAYRPDRFDLVISDLGLPDGDGLELMVEIQKQQPVPAIALSGYGMEEDIRRAKAAGFSAHLLKPIKLDALLEKIHTLTAS